MKANHDSNLLWPAASLQPPTMVQPHIQQMPPLLNFAFRRTLRFFGTPPAISRFVFLNTVSFCATHVQTDDTRTMHNTRKMTALFNVVLHLNYTAQSEAEGFQSIHIETSGRVVFPAPVFSVLECHPETRGLHQSLPVLQGLRVSHHLFHLYQHVPPPNPKTIVAPQGFVAPAVFGPSEPATFSVVQRTRRYVPLR